MIDYKRRYREADPDGAFQNVGDEVEERREDVAGTENDFDNDQYD